MRWPSASKSWRALGVEEHDLAVEHVAARGERQLGEVARQRPAVARLQVDLAAVDERDRAEAVPLRLVGPAVAGRQRARRLGELREDGWGERQRHDARCHRRRLGLRAEVGRLPRDRLRRRRRGPPPVAQRPAADALLPRARVPGGPLRARRRDRALRRRRRPGLRRARPADPPGGVADRDARREDADAVHRVRPARARRRDPLRAAAGGAARLLAAVVDKPVDLTPATEDPDEAHRGCSTRRA